MADDNAVFIGNKPFMNYVTGVVVQFTTKSAGEVIIKARGKFISRAVDIAEVVMKRFLKDQIQLKDIKIDLNHSTVAHVYEGWRIAESSVITNSLAND